MSLASVFFIGVGLSMDACAVSFAKGISLKKNIKKYALLLGLAFGIFQGAMPLFGWWVGTHFEALITSIDHWIAFLLLGFIGLNMIRESGEERGRIYSLHRYYFREGNSAPCSCHKH